MKRSPSADLRVDFYLYLTAPRQTRPYEQRDVGVHKTGCVRHAKNAPVVERAKRGRVGNGTG